MKKKSVSYDRKIILALLRKDKEIEMLKKQIELASEIIAEMRGEKQYSLDGIGDYGKIGPDSGLLFDDHEGEK